jgi:hypothetical protein
MYGNSSCPLQYRTQNCNPFKTAKIPITAKMLIIEFFTLNRTREHTYFPAFITQKEKLSYKSFNDQQKGEI